MKEDIGTMSAFCLDSLPVLLSCVCMSHRSSAGDRKRTIYLIKPIASPVQGDACIHLIWHLMKRFLSYQMYESD